MGHPPGFSGTTSESMRGIPRSTESGSEGKRPCPIQVHRKKYKRRLLAHRDTLDYKLE